MRRYYYKDKKEIEKLLKDSQEVGSKEQIKIVADILEDIRSRGYKAVRSYTAKFDGIDLPEVSFKVTAEEIDKAMETVDEEFIEAVKLSIENVRAYHEKQLLESYLEEKEDGIVLGLIN